MSFPLLCVNKMFFIIWEYRVFIKSKLPKLLFINTSLAIESGSCSFSSIDLFVPNPFLYPLKTSENLNGALGTNGLIKFFYVYQKELNPASLQTSKIK